jgi:hypothetical protein
MRPMSWGSKYGMAWLPIAAGVSLIRMPLPRAED